MYHKLHSAFHSYVSSLYVQGQSLCQHTNIFFLVPSVIRGSITPFSEKLSCWGQFLTRCYCPFFILLQWEREHLFYLIWYILPPHRSVLNGHKAHTTKSTISWTGNTTEWEGNTADIVSSSYPQSESGSFKLNNHLKQLDQFPSAEVKQKPDGDNDFFWVWNPNIYDWRNKTNFQKISCQPEYS